MGHHSCNFPDFFSLQEFCDAVGSNHGPILALDWGKKTSGLAISGPNGQGAFPSMVVPSGGPLRYALKDHWVQHHCGGLVVGFPTESPSLCKSIETLVHRLFQDHGWPIFLLDESHTSQDARCLLESAFSLQLSQRNKRVSLSPHKKLSPSRVYKIDHHSAALLLQEALCLMANFFSKKTFSP